jgi:hypothetical protein
MLGSDTMKFLPSPLSALADIVSWSEHDTLRPVGILADFAVSNITRIHHHQFAQELQENQPQGQICVCQIRAIT